MSELATPVNGQSRRGLLKRGLLLAAGAVGVSAAGRDARAATRLDTGGGPLRLHGVDWRIVAPGRTPGAAIPIGEHAAVYGDLLDSREKPVGQFFGSRLAVQAHPGRSRADASVEVHTFVLPEGTIVGMGTSVLGRATFAIVGGTGAYAGAKGSYTANQRLRELGGDGTADFVLTLSL
jgi:hypothetical protein